jgi:hypothetical protein
MDSQIARVLLRPVEDEVTVDTEEDETVVMEGAKVGFLRGWSVEVRGVVDVEKDIFEMKLMCVEVGQ